MPKRSKYAGIYEALSDVQLRELHTRWVKGEVSKQDIEADLGDIWSRGQGITRAWRGRLGEETKGVDPRDVRIAELEARVKELEGELRG